MSITRSQLNLGPPQLTRKWLLNRSSARAHLDQQKQLQDQVQMFREWFEQHILLNPKDTTGSREGDTIIVIPDVSFHQKGHILGFSGRMLAFEE